MTVDLATLISAHEAAFAIWMAGADDDDRLHDAEKQTMDAFLAHVPATLDEARRKARYFLSVPYLVDSSEPSVVTFMEALAES